LGLTKVRGKTMNSYRITIFSMWMAAIAAFLFFWLMIITLTNATNAFADVGPVLEESVQIAPASYVVRGRRYHPIKDTRDFEQRGVASWYGKPFHGRKTANGERYNMYNMTCAHKILPMNTLVEITNHRNGKKIIVRVNDRGPYKPGRIVDLSYAAAKKLGIVGPGTAAVTLRVIPSKKHT